MDRTALALVIALVNVLKIGAGQLVVTVQHPGRVTMIDVNRRVKPEELAGVRIVDSDL